MTLLTLLSWNVNGVRAIHRKGFLSWLAETAPDILCLQETKAMESQLPVELAQPRAVQFYVILRSAATKNPSYGCLQRVLVGFFAPTSLRMTL